MSNSYTLGDCGPVEAVYKDGSVTMRLSKCAKKRRAAKSTRSKPKFLSRSHPSRRSMSASKPSGQWALSGLEKPKKSHKKKPSQKCYCGSVLDKAGFIIAFQCGALSQPKLKAQLMAAHPEAHKIRVRKCYTPYGVSK